MTNSNFQEDTNWNDHIAPMYDVTPEFKQFLRNIWSYMSQSVRTILSRMSFDKHQRRNRKQIETCSNPAIAVRTQVE